MVKSVDSCAKRSGLRLSAATALLLLSACGADGRYIVIGNASAPSTSGVVEVDALDGDSTQVAIHFEALHAPSRLGDGLKVYMVWFEPLSGSAVRAGELRYDTEARTGDLSQTSPFRQFTLKITAERDTRVSSPSNFVVASQRIMVD